LRFKDRNHCSDANIFKKKVFVIGLEELLGWLGMFVFVLFRLVPDGRAGGAGGALEAGAGGALEAGAGRALEAAILLSCSRSFFFCPL